MKIIKITSSIFLITFVAGLATVNFFNHFYAKKALKSDAEQLLFQFHDSVVEAHKMLDSLPEPENFQCDNKNIEKLAMLEFEHPNVRLVGVFHDNKQACASQDVHIDIRNYHERVLNPSKHQLSNNYSLATVSHGDKHIDLLLVKSHADSKYFASINPFMVNYLTEFACTNCLEYEFIIGSEPKLKFSGRSMAQESFIEYNLSRLEESIKIELKLRGTEKFYNYYKELSWFSTIIFSLLFASIITLLSYKLLTIRQSLEHIIKDALKYKEFTPFYQPIVHSKTGHIVGVEMLARWVHKDGLVVPPYQFIPFAEDSGLIVEISEQLIEKSIQDIKVLGWDKTDQFISVNIVPEHLENSRLYELIEKLLEDNKVPPSALSLEITERLKIENLEEARESLNVFYNKGIELKLDDAGTAYGGFSYIQELGISTIKIDKMFVDTIDKDDLKSSVLESIISFAKSSNLDMIAEGVEEEAQVSYLQKRDVFLIQGYFYAKPMPIDELVLWIRNHKT
ncbi:EAL domain-containing protein [Pseudoalteromonas denitrificans]|uniref:EAL domain, c-di-GMP-specific phosphodiesterase class I (Or its enzymatically inactive variant) n=1 Tax=Pseudoalteromonas denitrificans DSM 6059 TaxID=1123010 RepID=A0A1I1LZ01_9GAMM|nr:EAL domain-containing protein [Pseudoalteromonas denitrificans]SFC78215.1 EAL domain, c-di-GMP-specific phosphodiesterase class I (or its enzymatically inactive variant) [Pseudoalteromonas denitrificans DSM 6059]